MSYASWPASLPAGQYQGFAENSQPNWAEDQGEIGTPMRRLLTTKRIRTFSFSMMLTDAQKTVVDTFFDDTINQIEYFYWTHPVTSEAILVRLQTPPIYNALTYSTWMVDVSMVEV